MEKRYVVTNPKEVVKFGFDRLKNSMNAGKHELENDLAAFIYYPCLAVVERDVWYADITAAFNYRGYPAYDGTLVMKPESLLKHFILESEDKENIRIRFNPDYKEDYFGIEARIRNCRYV